MNLRYPHTRGNPRSSEHPDRHQFELAYVYNFMWCGEQKREVEIS